jgi:hypothetical protein
LLPTTVTAITTDIHDSHHSTRQSPQHTTSHCYSPQHTTSPALTTTYDTTLLLTTALNITYDTTATHHRSPHCYSTQHSDTTTYDTTDTHHNITTTHDTATPTDTNAYDTLPDHTLSSPLRYDPLHTLPNHTTHCLYTPLHSHHTTRFDAQRNADSHTSIRESVCDQLATGSGSSQSTHNQIKPARCGHESVSSISQITTSVRAQLAM